MAVEKSHAELEAHHYRAVRERPGYRAAWLLDEAELQQEASLASLHSVEQQADDSAELLADDILSLNVRLSEAQERSRVLADALDEHIKLTTKAGQPKRKPPKAQEHIFHE